MNQKNNINYKAIGNNIRYLRLSRHITQENLAELMDLSVSHIRNIESCNAKISLNLLVRFSNLFEISTDFILNDHLENKKNILRNLHSENITYYSEKELRVAIEILDILKNESI